MEKPVAHSTASKFSTVLIGVLTLVEYITLWMHLQATGSSQPISNWCISVHRWVKVSIAGLHSIASISHHTSCRNSLALPAVYLTITNRWAINHADIVTDFLLPLVLVAVMSCATVRRHCDFFIASLAPFINIQTYLLTNFWRWYITALHEYYNCQLSGSASLHHQLIPSNNCPMSTVGMTRLAYK